MWGAYLKNDFNNWDKSPVERVHLRFCKLYLGVGNKSSNVACRGELGKFPLIINIYKKLFKYITHLNSLPEMTIAKQAYLISKDTNAMDILKHYKCITQIPELESTSIHSLDFITKSIKQKYITFWKHKMENSSKLSFYCTFKEDYQLENYLTTIKNTNQRKTFTRFRINNHKLMIEYGRYQKIPQEERLCTFCQSNEVEDEYHFTMSCESYTNLRNNFLSTLSNAYTIDTN